MGHFIPIMPRARLPPEPEAGVEVSQGETDQTAYKPGSVPLLRQKAAEGGGHSSRPRIAARLARPTRTAQAGDGPTLASQGAPSLFGLAPGGACHAVPVTRNAVRSYRTLSPLPSFAEASEGKPCVASAEQGGLLSVALSLGSRPAGVTRRLVAVEPGLSSSSLAGDRDRPAV